MNRSHDEPFFCDCEPSFRDFGLRIRPAFIETIQDIP